MATGGGSDDQNQSGDIGGMNFDATAFDDPMFADESGPSPYAVTSHQHTRSRDMGRPGRMGRARR